MEDARAAAQYIPIDCLLCLASPYSGIPRAQVPDRNPDLHHADLLNTFDHGIVLSSICGDVIDSLEENLRRILAQAHKCDEPCKEFQECPVTSALESATREKRRKRRKKLRKNLRHLKRAHRTVPCAHCALGDYETTGNWRHRNKKKVRRGKDKLRRWFSASAVLTPGSQTTIIEPANKGNRKASRSRRFSRWSQKSKAMKSRRFTLKSMKSRRNTSKTTKSVTSAPSAQKSHISENLKTKFLHYLEQVFRRIRGALCCIRSSDSYERFD